MAKQESSVETFAGSGLKYTGRTQCHFVYKGDEKLGQRKVELIGKHVFNIALDSFSDSHNFFFAIKSLLVLY